MSMKQNSKKNSEKINIRDEFSKDDYKNDQFQVNSFKEANFSFIQMIKYSEFIQEEINKSDIIDKIEHKLRTIKDTTQIKDENIKTFLNLLNEEEVEINNDQYSDLHKLSSIFKIKTLNKYLSKYAKNHSKDIDFIISQIQENINEQNLTKEEAENQGNSNEFEKCLIDKINECFTNEKFNELPIYIVYRIIKESSIKKLDNNLLYEYIQRNKEERYILYRFLNLHDLKEEKFNELYENYINDQKSKSTTIKYYEYLTHNLTYIKELKEYNKSYEKQIKTLQINCEQLQAQIKQVTLKNQDLETNNKVLMAKISQKNEENEKFKIDNQKIQNQLTQENNENQQLMVKITQMNEENQQLKAENQKIIKNNEQLQTKINQMNEKLKKKPEGNKIEFDGQTNHRFKGIVHHLQGNINVTASSCSSGSPKNAIEFDNKDYFLSNDSNNWLKYDFKEKKIRPTHYSIKTRYDKDVQNPVSWFIEVSNTDKDDDWRIIDSRKGVTSVSKRNQSDTFDISTRLLDNEYYRYIRFRCNGDTSGFCYGCLPISSLEYFGYLIE